MKEREKQEVNTREKARGYVVDGRIRKKGWVSTGVNWLVWWANVCLLAASEPVNHYGPRKRLRATFTLSSISSRSLFLSLSDHHILSLSPIRILFLSLSLHRLLLSRFSYLSSPFLPHLPLVSSTARSSPSFPSVPSSPRCSMLQARYNAACRRPSCIFKRAVLLCSRYRPHHLDRPLDDRSPPSPTSVSLSLQLSLSLSPSFSPSLYVFIAISLFRG